MAKTAKTKNPSPKKVLLNETIGKLAKALQSLEPIVGKKEFVKRVKKSAKILIEDVKLEKSKKSGVSSKKAGKKKAIVKTTKTTKAAKPVKPDTTEVKKNTGDTETA